MNKKEQTALRSMDLLHPTVAKKFIQAISEFERVLARLGYTALITETYRTHARQEFLHTLGRKVPGKVVTFTHDSAHEYGYALDWVPVRGGEAFWDAEIYRKVYNAVDLRNYGLERLDFEMPHIQVIGGQKAARRAGIKANYLGNDI